MENSSLLGGKTLEENSTYAMFLFIYGFIAVLSLLFLYSCLRVICYNVKEFIEEFNVHAIDNNDTGSEDNPFLTSAEYSSDLEIPLKQRCALGGSIRQSCVSDGNYWQSAVTDRNLNNQFSASSSSIGQSSFLGFIGQSCASNDSVVQSTTLDDSSLEQHSSSSDGSLEHSSASDGSWQSSGLQLLMDSNNYFK